MSSALVHTGIVLIGFLIAITVIAPSFQAADLIKVLGIGTVAIGFAFQNILQNFLAGILLLLQEPFRLGISSALQVLRATPPIFGLGPRSSLHGRGERSSFQMARFSPAPWQLNTTAQRNEEVDNSRRVNFGISVSVKNPVISLRRAVPVQCRGLIKQTIPLFCPIRCGIDVWSHPPRADSSECFLLPRRQFATPDICRD